MAKLDTQTSLFRILFLIPITAFISTGALGVPWARAAEVSEKEFSDALRIYQKLTRLDVSFAQKKTLTSIGTTLETTGKLSVQRSPKKIIWEVLKPSHVQVVMTPDEVQMITDAETKHAQTQSFKLKDATPNPETQNLTALSSWLNLDAKALYSQYKIHQEKKGFYEFEPNEPKTTPFKKFSMELSKEGYMQTLRLDEKSGDSLEIKFGKPKIQFTP